MKKRKVMVMLEIETDLPISNLRKVEFISFEDKQGVSHYAYPKDPDAAEDADQITQVQVNVVKAVKPS